MKNIVNEGVIPVFGRVPFIAQYSVLCTPRLLYGGGYDNTLGTGVDAMYQKSYFSHDSFIFVILEAISQVFPSQQLEKNRAVSVTCFVVGRLQNTYTCKLEVPDPAYP